MPLLNVGDNAPDFTVKSHLNEDVNLAKFKGRWIVLWFYPVADTPG